MQQKAEYPALQARFDQAFNERQAVARRLTNANGNPAEFRAAQKKVEDVRAEAAKLAGGSDTNYIFLSFVMQYLPKGLVGLILGVIFTAAMSASSGEVNSLATVTMVRVPTALPPRRRG